MTAAERTPLMTEPFADVSDQLPDRHQAIILRVEAGSTVHGIALDGGGDDRDELAVAVEPPPYVTGVTGSRESFMFRTAPDGNRSGPDDLDLIVHGLRKFARLAMGGNPTIVQTFYVPADRRVATTEGKWLLDARDWFVTRRVAKPFLGYLTQQRRALTGDRTDGRGAKGGGRDPIRRTKYAAHMVRLGLQGRELLSRGTLELPMPKAEAELCRAVRRGDITLADAVEISQGHERELWEHVDGTRRSPLPDEPNVDAVNTVLHHIYQTMWRQGSRF